MPTTEPTRPTPAAAWQQYVWSRPDRERRTSPADDLRLTRAAERARSRYPGPVGELLRREILAHRDFGYVLDGSGLIPQVVSELLAEGHHRIARARPV
ncbi:MAG: hypothetical protein ACT4RN_04365 [Pseudonocardia sp.]